ncbi:MAG: hypothetical protein EAZ45_16455, partial [Oscillatoriales cyanobacterium]
EHWYSQKVFRTYLLKAGSTNSCGGGSKCFETAWETSLKWEFTDCIPKGVVRMDKNSGFLVESAHFPKSISISLWLL